MSVGVASARGLGVNVVGGRVTVAERVGARVGRMEGEEDAAGVSAGVTGAAQPVNAASTSNKRTVLLSAWNRI